MALGYFPLSQLLLTHELQLQRASAAVMQLAANLLPLAVYWQPVLLNILSYQFPPSWETMGASVSFLVQDLLQKAPGV